MLYLELTKNYMYSDLETTWNEQFTNVYSRSNATEQGIMFLINGNVNGKWLVLISESALNI